MIQTRVPTLTKRNRDSASRFFIRMQPWEIEYPTDAGFGVPWMPTPETERPIQRVPSGFSGPGGIGSRSFAQLESGGYHQGWRYLLTIRNRPWGVGVHVPPVATVKTRRGRAPL